MNVRCAILSLLAGAAVANLKTPPGPATEPPTNGRGTKMK